MLDLTKYKTAKGAATKLHEFLREKSAALGQNPDIEVFMRQHQDQQGNEQAGRWLVSWEAGPYEWAICLSGGDSMYAAELENYSGKTQVKMFGSPHWIAEPYYSFDLVFSPN